MTNKIIKISVRNIVEFILKSGDIDSRFMSQSRMAEGVKIHQALQKARKKDVTKGGAVYESEYKLQYGFTYKEFDFLIEGRADGILISDDSVFIEEIKSTGTPLDELVDSETHWAQAKFYAYMYCMENDIDSIGVMLTYCNIEKVSLKDVKVFERTFSAEALGEFFYNIVEQYYVWAKMDADRKDERDTSIKKSDFPYVSYRKGQREFAVMAYRAIQNRKNLFIEAPTGTGKTISAVFPAVKSLAEGLADKIFYLTAKTITRQAAGNAVSLMAEKGYLLSSITLTAKDKICLLEKRACNPQACMYARGHFDRVNDAVWDIITNEKEINRDKILSYAKKHTVCPHEFSLDVSLWVDIIICDYNYAFDPKASLKRFFGDIPSGEYILLVDEAHNLVERSREMFSAALYKKDFLEPKREFKDKDKQLAKTLGKINSYLLGLSKQIPPGKKTHVTSDEPADLYYYLMDFVEKSDKWLAANESTKAYEDFLELYFRVLDFLRVKDDYDERYTVYVENNYHNTIVKLLCLDPSHLLGSVLKKTAAALFFSATLTPLSYFQNVLGGSTDDSFARLPSPFDKDNACVIIENRISTRYKDRENSYEKIADALFEMIGGKRGNYFAYFSSYEYLTRVYEIFTDKYSKVETLLQSQNMPEHEREDFLSQFSEGRKNSLLAFAVLGGIFSEGIDLTGDRLIGSAIVGVGLPQISDEREVIMQYYEKQIGSGFEFAYMYPGMNKVLQAAGRVIRTHTDKGVILLIDDRFMTGRYLNLFPQSFQNYKKMSGQETYKTILADFWKTGG